MSEQQTQKKKPLFRIIFCPKVGTDQYGKEILGPGRDVGSVWERNDPSKPPVIRYDFDIANMSSAGVTFLRTITKSQKAWGSLPVPPGEMVIMIPLMIMRPTPWLYAV